MIRKITAIAFIAAAGVVFFTALDHSAVFDFDMRHISRRNTFSDQISEDLNFLKMKKHLPAAWDSIQYVVYNFHSEFQRKLIGHKKLKIKDDPQGRYRLEIEFIDLPDEKEPGVILQMSLFDIESNNKIFEIGRTHSVLPFLEKEKPSSPSHTTSTTKPISSNSDDANLATKKTINSSTNQTH